MGNLFTSLYTSAGALKVFDRQISTIQNNITNASTPGYARQTQAIEAMRFNLEDGLVGGVTAGPVQSARNEYAEDAVRRQNSLLGQAGQKAADLANVESLFSLSSQYGVSGSLNTFFKSFSQLAVNPNDTVARQTVIDRSSELAQSVNYAAAGLANIGQNAERQIQAGVDAVNRIAARIRDLNVVIQRNFHSTADAGIDASMNVALEELSNYANYSVLQQRDGSISVYFGGQTPLVLGQDQYRIQADVSSAVTKIRDAEGSDITSQVTTGKLAGVLEEKNTLVPGYMSSLNTLARALADTVNQKLQDGVDSSGATPVRDLFSYDPTLGEAVSLSVTGITPAEIAAASPAAPGGNGNALDIAGLVDTKLINNFTLSEYFGKIGGEVGRDLSTSREQQQTRTSMLIQAKGLRDQASGVSIDEEATHLLQVQRAYQAAGKLFGVINSLADTVLGLIK